MHLLREVPVEARYSDDRAIADLAYAVHNLPDLLLRWRGMDEAAQRGALRRVEHLHPSWAGRFTSLLDNGAPLGWQLKSPKPK